MLHPASRVSATGRSAPFPCLVCTGIQDLNSQPNPSKKWKRTIVRTLTALVLELKMVMPLGDLSSNPKGKEVDDMGILIKVQILVLLVGMTIELVRLIIDLIAILKDRQRN
jgi:hypothetical protein